MLAWDQAFGGNIRIWVEEEDLANNPEEWDDGREEETRRVWHRRSQKNGTE